MTPYRAIAVTGIAGLTDLHVNATCAVWFPDGRQILITNDGAVGPRAPLRPAVVRPDGSRLRPLDGTRNPNLNLGCGDVSPDGTRITLEGFGVAGHDDQNGIYSIRASDGGGLVRLLNGPIEPPDQSPDGARVTFKREVGAVNPTGSGALFVMNADGTDLAGSRRRGTSSTCRRGHRTGGGSCSRSPTGSCSSCTRTARICIRSR